MRHLWALSALLALAPETGALAQQAADPAATAHAAVAPAPGEAAPAEPSTAERAATELTPNQRTLGLCQACHTLEKGARTLIGPNLHGVFGRRAASVEGYRYSANMRQLGETGHVWSEETLRLWLSNPRSVVPKTAMRFPGISSEQQINEFLPFLKELTSGS